MNKEELDIIRDDKTGLYFIVDESGIIYAHDICGLGRAEILLDEYLNKVKA